MSGVTVSISLSKSEQGKLYMQNMRRGERIKELRAGLRRVIELAEASGSWDIATAARAALEPANQAAPSNDTGAGGERG